ncbi:protein kinase [Sphaerisporangium sp. NPDC051017]|uniref:serine/threonine protein kinase n=1 Tax=Sphaerisporangium sp. NPDC051017 TaxID=3154636 RepID=UPI00342A46FA
MPEGRSPLGGAGVAPEGQGRLVGRRYRLLSPVGRGGMGMVWHAHDVLLDRDVAVKELILPFGLDHAGKQVAHRRMLREARSAARLSHPGIVTVHDVVEEDGRPWIVMELVRAWSLEQAVRQSGPLPVVQAAEIGVRVLDALRHAHAAGILHRDVKPGNVLLTADRVVLTDFGIAAIEGDVTITQTGLLMGSPAYIPPERLQGRPITHAADLWSFGATLYAAVEGRPPYEGPDAVAVLGAVLTQEPNRPQRAGALLPVVEGLLRKNPADRMPAAQAADLLERVLRSHGSGLPPIRHGERPLAAPLPTRGDSTPAHLLPPLDPPSGPLPSRIIETPSGPVRVPSHPEPGHDALDGGTDAQRGPYDALKSPSGGIPAGSFDSPRGASGSQPGLYDALKSTSGPFDMPGGASGPQSNPYDALRSTSGPHPADPYDALRSPSGPQPADPDALRSSSGPQRGAFDPFRSPSGPQSADPYDALRSTSGPQSSPYDPLRSPSGPQSADPYDALRSTSGPQGTPYDALRSGSGPQADRYDALRSNSGPQADRYDALRRPAESHPGAQFDTAPRSPRDALVAGTPDSRVWPESTSPDLADRLAKDIASDNPFGPRRKPSGARRSDEPDGPRRRAADDDTREGRSPVLLVLAGVGIVGVVAALLFVLWPTSSAPRDDTAAPPDAGAPVASGPADPSTSTEPDASPATTEIPSGFKARTGAGASVAVPQDWTVSASNQAVTYLGPKSSGRRVQVKKVPATKDDGLGALTTAKDEATLTDYAQIRLESSSFGDDTWESSVWEYTYTALNNVTTHAVTRHVSVDGDTAYEVTFTAPDAEWDQPDTRQTMSVLWNTFKVL